MKKITLLFIILFTSYSFAQVTIGTGNNETQSTPFDPYWGYTYSQSIYTAAEINASAGNITGLQWYYSWPTVGTLTTSLTIYIANTSKSSFASTTDWVAVGTLTPVYTGGLVVTGQGYVTITFDTPFAYDGTSNLIIAVDENDSALLGITEDFYNSVSTANRSIYYRSDSTNPDPAAPPTGTRIGYIPNVILNGLSANATPGCSTLTQSTSINPNGNLAWNAASGGPTGYNLSIGTTPGASDVLPVTDVGNVTSYNLSSLGLANSTTYYATIVPYNGAGSASGCTSLSFTTRPPSVSNDLCTNAISVLHQTSIVDAASATPTAGTIINAFDTNRAAEVCNGFTGNANDDVWYSFVATTADVNITYELNFDGVATLYSGSCGALTYISCADNTVTTAPIVETITYSGLSIGQTYYTRIYSYGTAVPTNGNFNIKVWTSSTLSIDDIEDQNGFTYFPNPVKNTLNLKAHNNIQNVSIYNMLGQEVVRTSPNSVNNEVDMSSLQAGAYIVRVTINDNTKTIRIIKQ